MASRVGPGCNAQAQQECCSTVSLLQEEQLCTVPQLAQLERAQVLQASLLEREVGGLLHKEVSIAHIALVQHGVRLDGGHTWGVLDLQRGRAVRLQDARAQGDQPAIYRTTLPVRE